MSDFFYVLDDEARLLFVDDDPILREFAQVALASAAAVIDVALNWRLLSHHLRFTLRAARAEAAVRGRFAGSDLAAA